MKKLLLIIPAVLASQMAYGARVSIWAVEQYYSIPALKIFRAQIAGTSQQRYFECSNNIEIGCTAGKVAGALIEAIGPDSVDANDGMQGTNPIPLSDCTWQGCGCSNTSYLAPGGAECTKCPTNSLVSYDYSLIHTESTINACMCASNMLRKTTTSSFECVTCPANATCNGTANFSCKSGYYQNGSSCAECPLWSGVFKSAALNENVHGTSATGATAITDCYINSGTYYDRTGTFIINSNCPYKL